MKLEEALDKLDQEIQKPFQMTIRTYENKKGITHVSVKLEPKLKGISDIDIIKFYLAKIDLLPFDLDWMYYGNRNGYLNAELRETPNAFYYIQVKDEVKLNW